MRWLLQIFFVFAFSFVSAKVYDCFLFFNEEEVLEIRLHELDPVVDVFVLVEAKESFQGRPKPLYYEQIKDRFKQFAHKIIHVVIENSYKTPITWERETYQRNQIMRALTNCSNEDVIFISDVDEIMDHRLVPDMVEDIQNGQKVIGCNQPIYRYFLNRKDENATDWIGSVGTNYKFLRKYTPQKLRDLRKSQLVMPNAGWHFTSMGGYDRFVEKITSFSHSATESPVPTTEQFFKEIQTYKFVPLDSSFPWFVLENIGYLTSKSLVEWQ